MSAFDCLGLCDRDRNADDLRVRGEGLLCACCSHSQASGRYRKRTSAHKRTAKVRFRPKADIRNSDRFAPKQVIPAAPARARKRTFVQQFAA